MADLKTQLEIGVDASAVETGVGKAKKSLSDLAGAANVAGTQAADGLAKAGAGAESVAKKIDSTTKNLIANAQRNLAAIDAGVEATGRMSSRFLESLARQRGAQLDVLKPYLQQLDQAIAKQKVALGQNQQLTARPLTGVTTSLGATNFSKPLPANLSTSLGATSFGDIPAAAGKATAAVSDFNRTFGAAGLTAKQTTAALRQVPSQLTDIVVSLQGGQAPLTVLLQQGGQLKDVFGGIGPAARALSSYLIGLVNPFTLAAAAVGALALAYKQGTEEIDAYAKALILSGNATGTTVSKLNAQAEAISKVTGTQAAAAEALAQFAADGNVAANSIQRFAQVAVQLERTAGQAVAKTVEQFSALGKDPLQASIKLNETTRFLTTSLYQQIKALEDQGRVADAAAAAQNGFASAMESRTAAIEQRLGSIERAWKGVKDAAAGAWSAMLNVGRGDQSTKLQQARADLEALQDIEKAARARGGTPTPQFQARLESQRQIVDALDETIRLENRSAAAQADGVKQTKARIDFDAIAKKNLVDKGELLKKEIELIKNAGKAAGATQKEINDAIAGARERFKPAKGPWDSERGVDKSDMAFDLSAIKAEADRLVGIYSDAERVLETLRAGALVKDKEYYESRRQLLALESSAKEDAFRKEIARLEQEQIAIGNRNAKDKQDAAQNEKDAIDNRRAIAKAESDLAILRARTASKNTILTLEEANALDQLEKSYRSATLAAQDYLDTQNRSQNRLIEGLGKGAQERGRTVGINQIDDNFAGQRRELENLKILGKLAEGEYEQRLRIIQEFQQKSLASFDAYYDKLIQMQGNASIGAAEATANYIDEARNVAASTEQFVSNTFNGLEDSLTKFLTTGKGGFKEFATSIVADINRIIVKQMIANALTKVMGATGGDFGAAGSFFSALMGSGAGSMSSGAFGIGIVGYANGGRTTKGGIYEVNENGGPGELFNVGSRQYLLASQEGRVEPQRESANAQAMTVINNFTLSAPVDRRTQAQVSNAAGQGVQRAMARNS